MKKKSKNKIINLTAVVVAAWGCGLRADTKTTTYGYDDLGRVSDVARTGTNISKTHYEYDLADNRTNKTVTASLPYSTILIADAGVDNKRGTGTASYTLRADGNIVVTRSLAYVHPAGFTYYVDETVVTGRWLKEGYSANNFQVKAVLANPSGSYRECTSGYFNSWMNGGYGLGWGMTSTSNTDRKACRFFIEIRETANPEFVLGSAYITLMAGAGLLVTR